MICNGVVHVPEIEIDVEPVFFTDETMKLRNDTILRKMREKGYDALVIYADLEHGGNFEYLVGFLPRFEEALLVLHQDGTAYAVLGNENLNKAGKSRIPCKAIHMPHFSLPNQPMDTNKSIVDILKETNIQEAKTIGLVGWKHFTSKLDNNVGLSELPYFIVDALTSITSGAIFQNATGIFIGENGARTNNNANEFAHYEYGATIAGNAVLKAMEVLDEGMKESDVAAYLDVDGQAHNVITIMATGARFEQANMYPSAKKIKRGDTISITTGYKGGLQSRGGFAVANEAELPKGQEDYLNHVAIPYYQAVVTWLDNIHIGMQGQELYEAIETVFPKNTYGWSLNPGHLCGDEEWLSSPIYPNSKECLQSGMLFQIDIIPSVKGYGGISCESGIFLADEQLRKDIKMQYPKVWKRIEMRRAYMQKELGIVLSKEILPTSIATVFCRPFLLDKTSALHVVDCDAIA